MSIRLGGANGHSVCRRVRSVHDASGWGAGSPDDPTSRRLCRKSMASYQACHRELPPLAGAGHPVSNGKVCGRRRATGSFPDGRRTRDFRAWRPISRAWRGTAHLRIRRTDPVGSGDAFTRFNGRFPLSPLAHLTASSSGIEAQHAIADAIAERAIARGSMHIARRGSTSNRGSPA